MLNIKIDKEHIDKLDKLKKIYNQKTSTKLINQLIDLEAKKHNLS